MVLLLLGMRLSDEMVLSTEERKIAMASIFDKIEIIKEEYVESPGSHDGATTSMGQYKFIKGKDILYVLWGDAKPPEEIKGKVLVTDVCGEEEEMNAKKIVLDNDTPIFVELVK